MPANTISCSKVQLAMAVLAAIVIAAVVFAVGYGAGSTYRSRQIQNMLDSVDDFSASSEDFTAPPF